VHLPTAAVPFGQKVGVSPSQLCPCRISHALNIPALLGRSMLLWPNAA